LPRKRRLAAESPSAAASVKNVSETMPGRSAETAGVNLATGDYQE